MLWYVANNIKNEGLEIILTQAPKKLIRLEVRNGSVTQLAIKLTWLGCFKLDILRIYKEDKVNSQMPMQKLRDHIILWIQYLPLWFNTIGS